MAILNRIVIKIKLTIISLRVSVIAIAITTDLRRFTIMKWVILLELELLTQVQVIVEWFKVMIIFIQTVIIFEFEVIAIVMAIIIAIVVIIIVAVVAIIIIITAIIQTITFNITVETTIINSTIINVVAIAAAVENTIGEASKIKNFGFEIKQFNFAVIVATATIKRKVVEELVEYQVLIARVQAMMDEEETNWYLEVKIKEIIY